MEAAEKLSEFLAGEDMPEEQKQSFQVTDQAGAIWAMRKLKKLLDEQKEIADAAAEETAVIQSWKAGEEKRLQGDMAYFEMLLTEYHKRILEADPRTKTIKLPNGQLKARAQQPEFVRDDVKLLSWLESTGAVEYIVVKKSPDWAALKKDVQISGSTVINPESGEVIDGVTVVTRPDKFSVEVS